MSTILKALRRLEDEKQAQAVQRDLREAVAAREVGAKSGRSAWLRGALVGVVIALVAGGVVLGAWGWWARQATPAEMASPDPGAPAPRPEAAARPSASRETDAASIASSPRAASERLRAAPPAPVAPETAPAPVAAPPPAEPEALAPEFAVVEPNGAAGPDAAQVVELRRVDASVLFVSSTVWHPSAARRSARIELAGESGARELREGDEVGDFTILEIEPAGVVFDRQGVRVRRRVGER
ncbi:MAG: hypothetical protein ACQGVK_12540 [Myxococcota bacterium]